MGITDSVTAIKGIGPKRAELLARLNVEKIEDFLFFYPRDYQDRRSAVKIGELTFEGAYLIKAKVLLIIKSNSYYRKKQTLRLLVSDGSGSIEVVFFNAKYLANSFEKGGEYYFYGRMTADNERRRMMHPEFSAAEKENETGILPIYRLTAGISQHDMRKWQRHALSHIDEINEYMPGEMIERNRLCGIKYALLNIHFPESEQKLKEAKFRLIFDELFFLQAGLLSVKMSLQSENRGIRFSKEADHERYVEKLPYKLTGAQRRVVTEIISDMESDRVMNRLVQGDVGSGKTAVAEIALYKACMCGYQGVLMAPTELLASQHYGTLKDSFGWTGIEITFLSGSMNPKDKQEALKSVREGKTGILVGTHAIIQPDVEFKNLGLVITDEQHRFGVNQRIKLSRKGKNPDILVMSATPIPRTLAMILYGDLDISVIDELPPGRQKIVTAAVSGKKRGAAYEFIKNEIKAGRQAYIVTPLIDDSGLIDARSAEGVYKEIADKLPGVRTALLHGEMKQREKDDTMRMFYDGEIDLLVSTVVIEVGINVPNATIILIESAERFGLAQLHQLRGRVGRGKERSYCILVTENETELSRERAETMKRTTDGFEIAEKDLALRGPGEFFGIRQHGLADLKIADLVRHAGILETVREEARLLLQADRDLSLPEHSEIKQKIRKQFDISL